MNWYKYLIRETKALARALLQKLETINAGCARSAPKHRQSPKRPLYLQRPVRQSCPRHRRDSRFVPAPRTSGSDILQLQDGRGGVGRVQSCFLLPYLLASQWPQGVKGVRQHTVEISHESNSNLAPKWPATPDLMAILTSKCTHPKNIIKCAQNLWSRFFLPSNHFIIKL